MSMFRATTSCRSIAITIFSNFVSAASQVCAAACSIVAPVSVETPGLSLGSYGCPKLLLSDDLSMHSAGCKWPTHPPARAPPTTLSPDSMLRRARIHTITAMMGPPMPQNTSNNIVISLEVGSKEVWNGAAGYLRIDLGATFSWLARSLLRRGRWSPAPGSTREGPCATEGGGVRD